MFKVNSQARTSNTAFITALYRAVAYREFQNQVWGSDFLAELFLPFHIKFLIQYEKVRAKGRAKEKRQTPGVYEYVLARTKFFDDVFIRSLSESIPQIVMLGAGYDTRALRFKAFNNNTRIIEFDMAATQNRKRHCLKKNNINIPEYLTLFPIDFNQQSLEKVLISSGYKSDKRTLFIWEGVSMYLEIQAVKETLKCIAQSAHHDSLLAFDYAISIPENAVHKYYGTKELLQRIKKNLSNEPFKFTVEEKKIEMFLNDQGHKIIRHLNHRQIEEAYLKKEDGSSVGRPNGMFCLVMSSPI